jgi:hydroxymethylpyrimidine pyrophosphatase-like HAD family hydrolase
MPASAVQLVVTDLDGTLSDDQERVHPRSVDAVRALRAAGVPLLVATGRRPRTAAWVLDPAGLSGPAVLLDGALGQDLGDGRTFHQAGFDPAAAHRVLDAFAGAGLEPCLFVDRPGCELLVGPHPSTHPWHLARNRAWTAVVDLARAVDVEPVLTFTVVGAPAPALEEVARAVGNDGSSSVTPDLVYGGSTLQVRPSGVSKWSGVLAFCADQGLDPGRVLAVGDGTNDVELLEGAKIACAVAGGHPAALALADHVIGPPAAGGWAAVLDLV